jgi:GNAT superfamily N-acetyltransferase
MDDPTTFRPLRAEEWPEAMTRVARSFHGEPFSTGLFDGPPLSRFEQALRFYRALPWRGADLNLGAFVGDVLVGLSLGSRPGGCHVCEDVDPQRPPRDPAEYEEWVFEVNTRTAHADQGPHAWVSRLVVDPALQGSGLGRELVARSLDGFRREDGSVRVLLECQPHREAWYLRRGFQRVRTFPDPGQPDCLLLRVDLPRRSPGGDAPESRATSPMSPSASTLEA